MKKIFLIVAFAAVAFASPAAAQGASTPAPTKTDSVTVADLQVAMEQLATTLQALVARVANDPQLRATSLRAAQGAIVLTQVMLEQQTDVLQEALRRAADRLSRIPVTQRQ